MPSVAKPTLDHRRLLTRAEAADYLATTERHVRELWARRAIPAVRVGSLIRFDPCDLDAWIESNRVEVQR
jgi:excisionase family DNA binding protein